MRVSTWWLILGLYHALRGGRQRTTGEYIHGNRQMGLIPIMLSLMVTHISTMTLLGYPAEIYAYGGQYWVGTWGVILGVLLACGIFVPVFYPLQITSVNEVGGNSHMKLNTSEQHNILWSMPIECFAMTSSHGIIFPRYWPFVPVIKGQWHGALIFSLICAWINGWVSNCEVGDLRHQRAHYDVTVMPCFKINTQRLLHSLKQFCIEMLLTTNIGMFDIVIEHHWQVRF